MRNEASEGTPTPRAVGGSSRPGKAKELDTTISADYTERINRAIDFVVRDLSAPLKLDDVAREACFSPFHFHRIFKALMGETLSQFVKRQRLERALYLMSHAPHKTLTDIALDCGFAGSSDFSRDFKQHLRRPSERLRQRDVSLLAPRRAESVFGVAGRAADATPAARREPGRF